MEIDHRSQMTAVQQLVRRSNSAERLGLHLARCVVVAADEKRAAYERRLRSVPPALRDRMEFWPMSDLHEAYVRLHSEYLRALASSR